MEILLRSVPPTERRADRETNSEVPDEGEEYVKDRLDDQIAWYERKSQWNQQWYKWLRGVEILAAVTIPFVAGYVTQKSASLKFTVGFLGLVVAAIAGLLGLYRFQEIWIQYRTTCESLRHERCLFLTKTEPYNSPDPFQLLVQRVEALISKEHSTWSQHMKTAGGTEKSK